MTYIVESATETGANLKYWSCVSDEWVADIEEASTFRELELAEIWASDWQDFYDVKGIGRFTNITEKAESLFDVDSAGSE